MKDKYRKYKTCIFCSKKLTKHTRSSEHFFGKGFATWFKSKYPKHGELHWISPSDSNIFHTRERRSSMVYGGCPFIDIQSKSICKNCNNTWLSVEMDAVLPTLKALVVGESCVITRDQLHLLRRYFTRLGFLFDVESSDLDQLKSEWHRQERMKRYGATNGYPPCTKSLHWNLYKQNPSFSSCECIKVYIGHHSGVFGLLQVSNMLPYRKFIPDANGARAYKNFKDVTVSLGSLTVLIKVCDAPLKLECHAPYFPLMSSCSKVQWPPAGEVTYEDIFRYYGHSRTTSWLRELLRDKLYRDHWEQQVRKGEMEPHPLPPKNWRPIM